MEKHEIFLRAELMEDGSCEFSIVGCIRCPSKQAVYLGMDEAAALCSFIAKMLIDAGYLPEDLLLGELDLTEEEGEEQCQNKN